MDNDNIAPDASTISVFYFSEIFLAAEKKSAPC